MLQTWKQALVTATGDGSALANTTTATSILATQAKLTLPANYFVYPGQKLRIKAGGRISNIVTTPGTLTLDVRLNATPIIVFTGGAIPLNTTAKTNVTWEAEIELVCRAIGGGTSAQILGIGKFVSESVSGAAAGVAAACMLPATAPAVGTGFDSTAANLVDLYATWSIANAGNSITLHTFELEVSN